MTFGAPAFFWAALALLPLAAVYFIRVRPRRQPVNAFFLWQRVFQQKAASSLFQRLRNLLSLLLLALAFLAAVTALTRPRFDDGNTPDLLVVIDSSASMQTLEKGGTRHHLAKQRAASWIAALNGSQRAAIASVSTRLEYHANLTTHTRLLHDALDAIPTTDLPLDPDAFAGLAMLGTAADGDRKKTRILFLTDRRPADIDPPPGVEVVTIGGTTENIGITAADLRWDGPGRATLFVTLVSGFPDEREVELELVSAEDGTLARLFTMKLPPEGDASESIPLEDISPGAWRLQVRGGDPLSIDDSVPLGLNAPHPIPVRVKARNPYFFQQCVAAFSRADSLFIETDSAPRLVLAEGAPPEGKAAIVFAPAGESTFWLDAGPELPPGPPEVLAKDHPLLARIDPALMTFDGARKLTAPRGSVVVLAHADGTPLLYTSNHEAGAAVVFNMDPARGDFFLSPWFPVFVHEAAVLLTGRGNAFPSAVPTGTRLDVPGTGNPGNLTFHKGETTRRSTFESPHPVERVGHYTFTRDAEDWHVGGAVLSPAESRPPSGETTAPQVRLATGPPAAAWLLLAAILIVIVEEFLYHRRKVG